MNKEISANEMSLFSIIREDFKTPSYNDPAFSSKIELIFNYPGVWSIVFYRIANKLYKKNFKILARIIMGIFSNVDIHPACKIGRRVFIDHAKGIVIGQTAIIGNDIIIYQGVTLGGVHLKPIKRHPTIEDGVVVGAGAKILGDITIGKNSKIGANSVVVHSVPPYSTAVGIPAKVIKKNDLEPLDHNNLDDISANMFRYLSQRIFALEEKLKEQNIQIPQEKDDKLEKIYKVYIKSCQEEKNTN